MSDYLSVTGLRGDVERYLAVEAERFTVGDPAADPPTGDMTQATVDAFIKDALRSIARAAGLYTGESVLDGSAVPERLADVAARYAAGLILSRLGLGERDAEGRSRLVREALSDLAADSADPSATPKTDRAGGEAFPPGGVGDFTSGHNPYEEG